MNEMMFDLEQHVLARRQPHEVPADQRQTVEPESVPGPGCDELLQPGFTVLRVQVGKIVNRQAHVSKGVNELNGLFGYLRECGSKYLVSAYDVIEAAFESP